MGGWIQTYLHLDGLGLVLNILNLFFEALAVTR
jgi:hypothetical protein